MITTTGIFLIAALVYLRQNSRENKVFALFASSLGAWVLFQFLAQLLNPVAPAVADIVFRLALCLPAFFAVEFYSFTKYYCGRGQEPRRAAMIWHYAIPLLAAGMSFVPGVLYTSVMLNYTGITVEATLAYYALIVFVAIYLSMGLGNLIMYLRRNTQNVAMRYRTKFLLFGVATASVIIFGTIILFSDALVSQLATPVAVLSMVSLIGYAIVKHRLFDIRLIAIRLLAYLLSLLTVAVLYTFLAFGVFASVLNVRSLDGGQELGFVLIAMILALTFTPLKRFFDKATRAVFYQDGYEMRQVLDRIGTIVVSKVDLNRLVKDSLGILREALKSEAIAVMLVENDVVDRTIGVGKMPRPTEVFSAILRHNAPLTVVDDLETQDSQTYHTLQQAGISLVVRLETSKDLIGYVVYGAKVSGRIYTDDDIKLMRIVADELAVSIQNAMRFEEITHFNETLQQQVRDATTELRDSNDKLKSLDEAKDEFISMASHQLRTPLTSVKGYLSMVLEGDAGKLNPTQHQLLEQAFASSQRMVYLISDFLNVSRLQTGKFTIERTPVSLNRVVEQEVNQLRNTAESRNLKLICSVPSSLPMMQLDESKLRQTIMNFVDNAIFYSRSGDTIRIDLIKTAKDVMLTVQDQGIGVPSRERHRLFTKFYRASNARTVRPDGTGVGLFMAKKAIVAHGGSIIFESVEGKGSTFGFRLPLQQALAKDHAARLPQQ